MSWGEVGEKNLFISFVPSFCAPPVPLQSLLSRDSRGWIPLLANQRREKLLPISLSCASPLPAPLLAGPPVPLAAVPPLAPVSPPHQRKQKMALLPSVVSTLYTPVLMVSLYLKEGQAWAEGAATLQLKQSCCSLWVVTRSGTPSLPKKRAWLRYSSWYKIHIYTKFTQTTHLATQSSHYPERRFNEKVSLFKNKNPHLLERAQFTSCYQLTSLFLAVWKAANDTKTSFLPLNPWL